MGGSILISQVSLRKNGFTGGDLNFDLGCNNIFSAIQYHLIQLNSTALPFGPIWAVIRKNRKGKITPVPCENITVRRIAECFNRSESSIFSNIS